ncbi:MAG: hypothetical protein AB7O63_01025 [Reyranellaceae bacterium]
MDGENPTLTEKIVEGSCGTFDEENTKQRAEASARMRQLLQGLRTAATNSVLGEAGDLDELARKIDAARQRRPFRQDDHA